MEEKNSTVAQGQAKACDKLEERLNAIDNLTATLGMELAGLLADAHSRPASEVQPHSKRLMELILPTLLLVKMTTRIMDRFASGKEDAE